MKAYVLLLILLALFGALSAQFSGQLPPNVSLPVSQLRDLIIVSVVFSYLFAAGRIADFLSNHGKSISRRELLLSPFAYMVLSCAGMLFYFSSGAWVPPQNTIITGGIYVVLIPLGIVVLLGAFVLHSFFYDRMSPMDSFQMSLRIALAPLFDGLKGYWTALGGAAIVVLVSSLSFWSSGGNFSLITVDFLHLSALIALYFLYQSLASRTSEDKAANFVTMLVIVAPALLRTYFKELVCAVLAMLPFSPFSACPLYSMGNEVTLALSVAATLLILLPVIPFVYAIAVNLLRVETAFEIIVGRRAMKDEGEKKNAPPLS